MELGIRNEELGILEECGVGADLCVGPFIDDGTAPFRAVGAAICRPGDARGEWRVEIKDKG